MCLYVQDCKTDAQRRPSAPQIFVASELQIGARWLIAQVGDYRVPSIFKRNALSRFYASLFLPQPLWRTPARQITGCCKAWPQHGKCSKATSPCLWVLFGGVSSLGNSWGVVFRFLWISLVGICIMYFRDNLGTTWAQEEHRGTWKQLEGSASPFQSFSRHKIQKSPPFGEAATWSMRIQRGVVGERRPLQDVTGTESSTKVNTLASFLSQQFPFKVSSPPTQIETPGSQKCRQILYRRATRAAPLTKVHY